MTATAISIRLGRSTSTSAPAGVCVRIPAIPPTVSASPTRSGYPIRSGEDKSRRMARRLSAYWPEEKVQRSSEAVRGCAQTGHLCLAGSNGRIRFTDRTYSAACPMGQLLRCGTALRTTAAIPGAGNAMTRATGFRGILAVTSRARRRGSDRRRVCRKPPHIRPAPLSHRSQCKGPSCLAG